MSAPVSHDPRFVNTKDACWVRRAVTPDGRGLYAVEGSCQCPEFLLVPLEELAAVGIVGSADVLPAPTRPEPEFHAFLHHENRVSHDTVVFDPLKHLVGFGRRDAVTGMLHGHIRWPDGTAPTPFSCRWCGDERGHHGRQWMPGKGVHAWVRPTEAQMKARMLARRNARKAVCRCPVDDDRPRPFAPVVDPYSCEADDCNGYFSELSPFGVQGGPVHGYDAKVSRACGQCDYRTSVWHVDDGSAEVELNGHVTRVHGGQLVGGAQC